MKLNFIKHRLVIIILGCIIMFSCILAFINLNRNNERAVEYSAYETTPNEAMPYSRIIDGNTHSTSVDLKSQNMLYIPSSTETIYLDYGLIDNSGDITEVLLQIYYDYELINFKVSDNEYSTQYAFDIKDGKKIKIPVHIDENALKDDNKIHKLLIVFTEGYNQNAAQFDRVTDEYGLNQIYDVVHTLDYSNEVYMEGEINKIIPKTNFEKSYSNLLLNLDYNNSEMKNKGGIINPEPSMQIEKNTQLPLMYNIDKYKVKNDCLIIITANYKPLKINENNYYQLIKLDGEKGTANGSINIMTPNKSGNYEIIGYVIRDPFKKQSSPDNIVDTSPRFTMVVTE
ncbi:MAG: hypothetical protein MJA31_19905 [Clostridia bacterium]|nr:hypothetical protein [Clostridia bacterium]